MEERVQNKVTRTVGVALIVFGLHILGLMIPEIFWGTHYLSFLSPTSRWTLLLISGGLIVSPFWLKPKQIFIGKKWRSEYILPLIAVLVMGLLFYAYPIYFDIYGDAPFLRQGLENVIVEMSDTLWSYVFSVDIFDPKVGGKTVTGIVAFISYVSGRDGFESYNILCMVSGILFIFLWSILVCRLLSGNGWRIVMILVGMLAPFMLMFYGHIELYALPMIGLMAYLLTSFAYLKKGKNIHLLLLLLLVLINIKLHITSFLLIPLSFALIILVHGKRWPLTQRILSLKGMLKYAVIPLLIVIVAVYIWHTRTNGNIRSFTESTLENALFIPFSSSEAAPLDRYNLFSAAHLSDFLNLMLTWSSAAVFIVLFVLLKARNVINWNNKYVMFMTFAMFVYVPVFFLLNPLLSMPIDWDLFSLPAPFLLVFSLVLVRQLNEQSQFQWFAPQIAGFALLGIAVVKVNAEKESLANRLETIGKWGFKTYWIGTSDILKISIDLKEDNRSELRQELIEELAPSATLGNDMEYAEILSFEAQALYEAQLYEESLSFLMKALEFKSDHLKTIFYLAKVYHELGQKESSNKYAKLYLQVFPDDTEMIELMNTSVELSQGSNQMNHSNSQAERLEDLLKQIEQERPENIGLDSSYAKLLVATGVKWQHEKNNLEEALKYYIEGKRYWKEFPANNYNVVIAYFLKGDYQSAFQHVDDLVAVQFPSQSKSLKVAIHTSLEAKEYNAAERYCDEYLRNWPDDSFILRVKEYLEKGERLEEARLLFRQG